MNETGKFSMLYAAPVCYFAQMMKAEEIEIEQWEFYEKQSFFNRCQIASESGAMSLAVPVEKPHGKIPVREIRISEHGNWRQLHWRALEAAYRNSPFFEFLADDFAPIFEKKQTFLFDFNLEILTKILELLKFKQKLKFSESFKKDGDFDDFREVFHPKKKLNFQTPRYYQVFEQKFGFLENLSVLDLVFNMGNEAREVLRQTAVLVD